MHCRKIILFFILSALLLSCGNDSPTSRETGDRILSLIREGDFTSLEETAPFLSGLSAEEQGAIRRTLEPFAGNQYTVDVRRQGLRTETLVLTTFGKDPKTIMMTLTKSGGQWILRENITFKQTIGFIPLEK